MQYIQYAVHMVHVLYFFHFFVLQRAFFYFICTVSRCDGRNRTRNIAVYTWRFSPLSYDHHPWATTVTHELQPSHVLYTYLTEHQEKSLSSFASCLDTFQLLNPLLLIQEQGIIASLPRCSVSMWGWCGGVTSCLDRWVGPPAGQTFLTLVC